MAGDRTRAEHDGRWPSTRPRPDGQASGRSPRPSGTCGHAQRGDRAVCRPRPLGQPAAEVAATGKAGWPHEGVTPRVRPGVAICHPERTGCPDGPLPTRDAVGASRPRATRPATPSARSAGRDVTGPPPTSAAAHPSTTEEPGWNDAGGRTAGCTAGQGSRRRPPGRRACRTAGDRTCLAADGRSRLSHRGGPHLPCHGGAVAPRGPVAPRRGGRTGASREGLVTAPRTGESDAPRPTGSPQPCRECAPDQTSPDGRPQNPPTGGSPPRAPMRDREPPIRAPRPTRPAPHTQGSAPPAARADDAPRGRPRPTARSGR
jgi:hypothetical protein